MGRIIESILNPCPSHYCSVVLGSYWGSDTGLDDNPVKAVPRGCPGSVRFMGLGLSPVSGRPRGRPDEDNTAADGVWHHDQPESVDRNGVGRPSNI